MAVINGTPGNDPNLKGGTENDTITGFEGNDDLYGSNGIDDLIGGSGNDTLVGGAGFDTLTGGAGKDVFKFTNVIDWKPQPGGSYHVQSADGFDIIKDFNMFEDTIQSYVPATPDVPAHFKHILGAIIIERPPVGFNLENSNLVSQTAKTDFNTLVSDRVNFATLFDSTLNLSVLE
ncbi:calcium-binding protein [Coleofasciculus sp. FACHB-64]|uniref:calcium-binding protein n=1 Tax=Cyanophyceae TaxID=3028117 RepID=UPI001689BBFF|nr:MULTISPECIES: calcium-binding protein [unclassified Coleofasciculus]MBD1838219.1 calcium-binding protein [Coleofasciculus sp. FACHB-501]MBD2046103.1 calcium-binding protein [Coleofasciculus sp. FACHB-64]